MDYMSIGVEKRASPMFRFFHLLIVIEDKGTEKVR
jgi:hypothetical protein